MHKALSVLAAALLAAGCAVGPDYERPHDEVPERFARAQPDGYGTGEAEAEFWRTLDDPVLTALVNDALSANQDLRVAVARREQARALRRHARFDRIPTVTAGATAADLRSGADGDTESYDVRVEAAWELDFFGRVRRGVEAQTALASAGVAELAAAQVAVVGELARAYFELRGLQQQLRVARDNAANQQRTLKLVEKRLDAGSGTDFDMARARTQLEGTLARIPALEAETAVAMHRVAVLTGRAPGALIETLSEPAPLPAMPAQVPVGTPATLLRRRPDVVAAERRLASATAQVGVATADLFPRVALGGLIGSQAAATGALFERDSEVRMIALGINWSFLDVGRVRSRIAAADADADAHLAQYQQTVLLALEETENAMVRYARVRQEQAHLERAAAAGADAARLARLRFDGGAADLLHVLDAERAQLDAEDRLEQARARAAVALVALYRSLAGGWVI